ncbi:hypothetical protein ACX1HO_19880 [Yersinia enterocolitica]|uniref:hypothetical protein n=1 Tax=Yersinia enterocolitica TaxID=630 RepID=UPI001C8E6E84|nr:hypothetical protein [Yersinia enterocolitica]EKN3850448.1 hypothetical protein [Yersinia enterocolitica]EKN5107161.1 hypothetical protein [Yersinia enterocolitica]EKN6012553.1 hypothetical protein [Yersinia enterocolitica]ELI8071327.1 hypothetical protein [Yersinia enterocolitica]ELI8123434.1 hypothetical protein [Yersinia enterocolitica]
MKMFLIGMVITSLYFFAVAYAVFSGSLNAVTTYNELGDFLSGAFSPLAFLWLVLGYLQQQKELQQNTKALELQAYELKNSVDQYREMVAVSKEQLASEREKINQENERIEKQFQPDVNMKNLKWQSKSGVEISYDWLIYNDAAEARNVLVRFTPNFGKHEEYIFNYITDKCIKLPKVTMKTSELPKGFTILISFESIFNKKYAFVYDVTFLEDGTGNIDNIKRLI